MRKRVRQIGVHQTLIQLAALQSKLTCRGLNLFECPRNSQDLGYLPQRDAMLHEFFDRFPWSVPRLANGESQGRERLNELKRAPALCGILINTIPRADAEPTCLFERIRVSDCQCLSDQSVDNRQRGKPQAMIFLSIAFL